MAAALWQGINMQAADGGLASCFAVANVAPSLIKNITEVQKCATLRDFASSYTEEDYIEQLDLILKRIRHEGRLGSGEAAALTGKLGFALCACFGRYGRAKL